MASRSKLSSSNYKQRTGVIAPDRGFVKQLKKLHSSFEVIWDNGSEVWEIWDFPEQCEPYHVMRVQTAGKSYRALGADVLLQLQKNIYFHNNFTPDQICDYLDEMDKQIMRQKEQDFRNQIEAVALDTFLHVQGVLQLQVPRKYRVERMVADA